MCTRINLYEEGLQMSTADIIKELRKRTGLNRREFCEILNIPYRTVTDWERGEREAPEYVLRLISYYIEMEMMKKIGK